MKLKIHQAIVLLWPLSLVSCADDTVKIAVTNDTDTNLGERIIELSSEDILKRLHSTGFYITDQDGKEIPSQLTYNNKIIFMADVPEGLTYVYQIHSCDTMPKYDVTVSGSFYPKRRDDVSYENELVGFRIYGPGTQKAGEKAFGYDLFFKYPTVEQIVPQLYAPETDDQVWAKVDSLRKIDNQLAEDFIKTFSYHLDHGKGMDCYAVGATLGAGVAALVTNDSINYPWCYDTAEIIDNGPLRFTLKLNFLPTKIGEDTVTEHRILTLDSKNHLNSTKVWYEGLNTPAMIVAGFPLRDDSAPFADVAKGIAAYADPTQGDSNGKALLGIIIDSKTDSTFVKDNHILLSGNINPKDTFEYKWGFAWDKTDIKDMESWKDYLESRKLNYTVKIL